MSGNNPIYPGFQGRIAVDPTDAGFPDPASATVTITAPDGTVVVTDAAMNPEPPEFVYLWEVPADAGTKTFQAVVTVVDVDGGHQPVFLDVYVDPLPIATPVADSLQPTGLPPASQHWLKAWCAESDIPAGRLQDSNGQRIADINIGWMCSAATELLYYLSGRKYRAGRSVVRPTVVHRALGSLWQTYPWSSVPGYGSAWGFPAGWAWSSIGPGFFTGEDLSEIVLMSPIRRINQVLLDGAVLEPDQYVVYDRRRLVLKYGAGSWPWQQNTQTDPTMPGTAQIDYEWGPDTPDSGRLAAAELATELALSFSGQDACKLPARVQQIATQGTNVAVGDALEFLKEDLTGLPICDLFLRAVNPQRRRRRSVFLAPNSPILREL